MSEARARGRAWLEAQRDDAGALGYRPGQAPQPEPTMLLAAAGLEAPLSWLGAQDLGWAGRLVPTALRHQPGSGPLRERELARLLARRSETGSGTGDFDASLPAWGWVGGTAGWTEPTAHALLALRASGRHDDRATSEAQAFLLDRQGADGGWNYGNPRMLGQELESTPVATGWALLALAGLPPAAAACDAGLAWLTARCTELPTAHSLALLALAQRAHGEDPMPAAVSLAARQQAGGDWLGRCDLTALACAALATTQRQPCPLLPEGI